MTSPSDAPGLVWDPDLGRTVCRARVRVRYADTDRMGIAYNAHYLTWFEIGRSEFMRALGLPYREIEERGHNLPLVQAEMELRLPVRYDDLLDVDTWIDQVRSRVSTFAYCLRLAGTVVARGSTRHACVQADTGRATSLPAWLAETLRASLEPPGGAAGSLRPAP